jgi:hypothetical protein
MASELGQAGLVHARWRGHGECWVVVQAPFPCVVHANSLHRDHMNLRLPGPRLPSQVPQTPDEGVTPTSTPQAISSLELDERILAASGANPRTQNHTALIPMATPSLRKSSSPACPFGQAPSKTPAHPSIPLATFSPALHPTRSPAPTSVPETSTRQSILQASSLAPQSSCKRKISMTEDELNLMLERYAAKVLASKGSAYKERRPFGKLLFHVLRSTRAICMHIPMLRGLHPCPWTRVVIHHPTLNS